MNKEELLTLFRKYGDDLFRSNYERVIEMILNKVERMKIPYDLKIAELEAKVYTYENVISNSNFKPILKGNKITEKESKGE